MYKVSFTHTNNPFSLNTIHTICGTKQINFSFSVNILSAHLNYLRRNVIYKSEKEFVACSNDYTFVTCYQTNYWVNTKV